MSPATDGAPPAYTLRQLLLYKLRLGATGFGGPIALVGAMHRDLVQARGWFTEDDYNEGLALSQLAPGPLAAQLAIYLGYVHFRFVGATLAGLAFVLPSFLMVLALGWAYVRFGGLGWMQSVFYGVGAAVVGIIALSACKLTARSVGRDWLLRAVYAALAAVTIATETEMAALFLAAGLLVMVVRAPPRWLRPGTLNSLALLPATALLLELGAFFAKAGAFVFGSGLAIVPFLYGGVVTEHRWLTERQFVDAVAVAMITPGPVVITVAFVGYLVAGVAGACVAAVAVFLPCWLLTVLPAPVFRKYGRRPAVKAFVDGITAAAIGALAGAVVVIAKRSIVDWPTAAIALATVALLWRFKAVKEPWPIAAAAAIGLLVAPGQAFG